MKVVILRGIPGSGKSFYIAKNFPEAMVCSADHFFRNVLNDDNEFEEVYDFDITQLPEAHNRCMTFFLDSLKRKVPVIVVDNTFIREWEYQPYELAAKMMGYEVEIVEFRVETIEELKLCVERNKHDVPLNVVADMALRFEYDLRAKVERIIQ